MKAVVLYGKGDVRLTDFPAPELKPGMVKVAVAYCGICGSDFHKVEGKQNTHAIHYPIPLGHEVSGYIAEVGEGVTSFKVGDRVTVDPNWSCGKCYYCQQGMTSFCKNAHGVIKGMSQYWVSPEENVYHLPDTLDMQTAALAEPVACCVHGMDLLDVHQGDTVALIGMGAIGTILLQMIKNAGAGEIVVIEPNESKKDLAMELGATYFVSPADADTIQKLAEKLHIKRVMECVGTSPAQKTALDVAGYGATVVMFGVSDANEELPISLYKAFVKELTIKTSFINPHTMHRALSILASGALKADKIICKELSMQEALEEFHAPKFSKMGKVLVKIDREE